MRKLSAVATAIIAVCAIAGPAASSAAAAPHGTLSAVEYKQLTAEDAATTKALTRKSANFASLDRACRKAGTSTRLLSSVRRSCLDQARTLDVLTGFVAAKARCDAAIKSGDTTTTSTATADLDQAVCLNPNYQVLKRVSRVMYVTDVSNRRTVLSRGFSGVCLATLAGEPAVIRDEERFAFTSKALAADVALLTRVQHGKAPASDVNPSELVQDAQDFESSAKTLLSTNSPDKLTACPHE